MENIEKILNEAARQIRETARVIDKRSYYGEFGSFRTAEMYGEGKQRYTIYTVNGNVTGITKAKDKH